MQHGDATHYHTWVIFTMQCIFVTISMQELPVFTPNEYFWKNHWNQGQEEKWVAYARAIRAIIAEQGGFELYDNTQMEDKLEYKQLMKSKGKKIVPTTTDSSPQQAAVVDQQ